MKKYAYFYTGNIGVADEVALFRLLGVDSAWLLANVSGGRIGKGTASKDGLPFQVIEI